MTEYAAVVMFSDDAKAYQAIAKLRDFSLINEITSAALVELDSNGRLTVP